MEFDRLCKYAPKLVEDDQSKTNLFEERLHPHICRGLAALQLTSYAEVVGQAKSLDSVKRYLEPQEKVPEK